MLRQRRQRVKFTLVTVAFFLIVVVGSIGFWRPLGTALLRQFDTTTQTIGTKLKDESNTLVPDGKTVIYATTPPASGPHWANPAPWGIADTTLPDERTTYNLERGGIVIDYSNVSPDDLSKLKTLVRSLLESDYPKIILQPYPKLTDEQIAVSAWSWQLKLLSYDETQIVKFVKAHYQGPDAPEPNAN